MNFDQLMVEAQKRLDNEDELLKGMSEKEKEDYFREKHIQQEEAVMALGELSQGAPISVEERRAKCT